MAQHLRAWVAYTGDEAELFYRRTRSAVEVDFVVYGATGCWAIEVKNAARVHPEHVRGLKALMAEHPKVQAGSAARRMTIQGPGM